MSDTYERVFRDGSEDEPGASELERDLNATFCSLWQVLGVDEGESVPEMAARLPAFLADREAKAREEGRREGRREGLREAIAAAREEAALQHRVGDQLQPADWISRTGHRTAAQTLIDFAAALEARDLPEGAEKGGE